MPRNEPMSVTDADFEEKVLGSTGLCVVDFWAPWCGPCHQMAPALKAFAQENQGRVKVFKLNVDDNPKTAEKYEIRSIPTIIFFREGHPVDISQGALSRTALQEKLDSLLNE